MANPNTPTCPGCGTKFPGDPCKKCSLPPAEARAKRAAFMPSATRRRKRHGRQ